MFLLKHAQIFLDDCIQFCLQHNTASEHQAVYHLLFFQYIIELLGAAFVKPDQTK